MTTWIDPDFDEAMRQAALIAHVEVVDSAPEGTRARVRRGLAGAPPTAEVISIGRAADRGRGHAGDTIARGAYVIVVAADAAGYRAMTDTYGWFPLTDGERAHLPIRDPFTRAYVELDDLAAFAALLRDPARSRAPFVARHVARLVATPIAATRPIEVNEQIVALEALALFGDASHAAIALPYLASPHFQIRWSCARALGTCGGPAALVALVAQLAHEATPPVQAALALALADHADAALDRAALERALPRLADAPVQLSRNLMNPVMNALPAPRATLEALLAKLPR